MLGHAAAWDVGTHFAGLWAAVAPGAGFSETVNFLKLNLTGPDAPTWWEQKLFHLYDATDYAINLSNTPTIAYNGEIDAQRHFQFRDKMQPHTVKEAERRRCGLCRTENPETSGRNIGRAVQKVHKDVEETWKAIAYEENRDVALRTRADGDRKGHRGKRLAG